MCVGEQSQSIRMWTCSRCIGCGSGWPMWMPHFQDPRRSSSEAFWWGAGTADRAEAGTEAINSGNVGLIAETCGGFENVLTRRETAGGDRQEPPTPPRYWSFSVFSCGCSTARVVEGFKNYASTFLLGRPRGPNPDGRLLGAPIVSG
jgi:hypothetical protein